MRMQTQTKTTEYPFFRLDRTMSHTEQEPKIYSFNSAFCVYCFVIICHSNHSALIFLLILVRPSQNWWNAKTFRNVFKHFYCTLMWTMSLSKFTEKPLWLFRAVVQFRFVRRTNSQHEKNKFYFDFSVLLKWNLLSTQKKKKKNNWWLDGAMDAFIICATHRR